MAAVRVGGTCLGSPSTTFVHGFACSPLFHVMDALRCEGVRILRGVLMNALMAATELLALPWCFHVHPRPTLASARLLE